MHKVTYTELAWLKKIGETQKEKRKNNSNAWVAFFSHP